MCSAFNRHTWDTEMKWPCILINNKWVFMSFLFFLLRLFTEYAFPRARENAKNFLSAYGGCKTLSSPGLGYSSKTGQVLLVSGLPPCLVLTAKQLCPPVLPLSPTAPRCLVPYSSPVFWSPGKCMLRFT